MSLYFKNQTAKFIISIKQKNRIYETNVIKTSKNHYTSDFTFRDTIRESTEFSAINEQWVCHHRRISSARPATLVQNCIFSYRH